MTESERQIPPTVPYHPGVQRENGLERISLSGPTTLEQRISSIEDRTDRIEKRVEYILNEVEKLIRGRKP